ncbi:MULTISPECIES: phenylalanine--tRNA ligase subunit beta [unclassified Carboxydocella]|uniref:phenylalanine--tRNA ligase subunit beta n=1 Tax=unclassified Carboxydocella TaxID=2685367 RepID=UPI0009ABDEC3|nr:MULTISPECIES: phenylalanine--tRNA ligase subunit beta [unclassified Carboxydocella]GAW29269.1 phenylalanine--tRNA ligase subunit beta [Carboxydocella sp. ULO1]GAW32046.1 phenylalanine--tRNA ligase subunit beta [Carboxydocella sp. JDF658]
MRVSFNWLQEYVDLTGITPEELAEKMTRSGVAVENLHYRGEGIEKVVVGRVEKIEAHPNADKLRICQVNVGEAEWLQIVTGATNVQAGDVVPVALVGARLPGDIKIKRGKLRGIESNGMLCSGEELGIEKRLLPEGQQDGILILPPDIPLGADIKEILGLNDVVLELELTPNRSDCLSMLGVAYEVAALLGREVRLPALDYREYQPGAAEQVQVDIVAADLCKRYTATVIREVKLGPSPLWLQNRLQAAGVRPINNVVDITNYVMLELGQPLHAFDYDTLQGQRIVVRRAAEGEELTTLDGQERTLSNDDLVIADSQRAVALAGVMGGLDTEVTAATSHILLESAWFAGATVRRTSRKLGLRSEASLRFEKGLDPELAPLAARRAAHLLERLAGGQVAAGMVDVQVEKWQAPVIRLKTQRVNSYLGLQLTSAEIAELLERLGLTVNEAEPGVLVVTVPSRRQDLSIEADLIEEVARLYGYDRIPTDLPVMATTQGRLKREQALAARVRDYLVGAGLTEVINLSFANPGQLEKLNLPQGSPLARAVVIQNPLSEEASQMRTTLLPGLLETARRNYNRRLREMAIFEQGHVFLPLGEGELPRESLELAFLGLGSSPRSWLGAGQPYDFYWAKGIAEGLFQLLGITDVRWQPVDFLPTFHPGRTARAVAGGRELALIGQLHPDVVENYELSGEIVTGEMYLENLFAVAGGVKQYQPLARFPGIARDLALLVPVETPAQELLRVVREQGDEILERVEIFDVYQGTQVPAGWKSMALSLYYQAADRTLTDEEVNARQERILTAVAAEFGGKLR